MLKFILRELNEPTLKELRNRLRHMDEAELKTFGRQHRANPDSFEYFGSKSGVETKAAEERRSSEVATHRIDICGVRTDGEGGWRPLPVDVVPEGWGSVTAWWNPPAEGRKGGTKTKYVYLGFAVIAVVALLILGPFQKPWLGFADKDEVFGSYYSFEGCKGEVAKRGGWCGRDCVRYGNGTIANCEPIVTVSKQE
jgi:hypothetical protein